MNYFNPSWDFDELILFFFFCWSIPTHTATIIIYAFLLFFGFKMTIFYSMHLGFDMQILKANKGCIKFAFYVYLYTSLPHIRHHRHRISKSSHQHQKLKGFFITLITFTLNMRLLRNWELREMMTTTMMKGWYIYIYDHDMNKEISLTNSCARIWSCCWWIIFAH